MTARGLMSNKGFSFVELLIVGSIVFVLMGGVSLVLAQTGKNVWERAGSEIVTVADAQRALDRMTEDLRNGRQTNLSCPTAAAGDCTSPPCLVFDLADGSDTLTYQLNGFEQITRTFESTGSPVVVAGGITDFTPTCQINSLVRLEVTAEATASDGRSAETLSTRPLVSNVFVQNP